MPGGPFVLWLQLVLSLHLSPAARPCQYYVQLFACCIGCEMVLRIPRHHDSWRACCAAGGTARGSSTSSAPYFLPPACHITTLLFWSQADFLAAPNRIYLSRHLVELGS